MKKLDSYSENNCYLWTFRGLWAGFVIYNVSRVLEIILLLTNNFVSTRDWSSIGPTLALKYR